MSNIESQKRKGESFEAMFRRFTRRVSDSGKIFTLRGRRYFEKAPTKNKMHESALRRINKTVEIEYLLRSGKITEEQLRAKKRRR